MKGLRELTTPLVDMSGRLEYLELPRSLDPFFAAGRREYWKALYLDGLADAAIDTTAEWAARRRSNDTLVIIRHCGGAISRVGAEETAFADRSAEWMLSIDSTWDDATDDQLNLEYTRESWNALDPFSTVQTYFNFPACSRKATRRSRRPTAPTTPGWHGSRPPTTPATASAATRTFGRRPRLGAASRVTHHRAPPSSGRAR